MKWNVLGYLKSDKDIVSTLLKNRGLKTRQEITEFLNPNDPSTFLPNYLGINSIQLKKAIDRIKKSIKKGEPVIVYGDYDVDGITSTTILWETLNNLGAKVMPFIPGREKEGYGLSIEGIDNIVNNPKYGIKSNAGLIITVDNGIVANKAVDYANKLGLDVIIIDHHEKPKKLPKAFAFVHTLKMCAAGITYYLANQLIKDGPKTKKSPDSSQLLELASIATIADLVPLIGPNRSIVKYGLKSLQTTTRPGLRALFDVAGIEKIGTYEIGFMIGPRINASGRIESALTALRLLCSKSYSKAIELAKQLNDINKERQTMLEDMSQHAKSLQILKSKDQSNERIIVLEHESYHQGVIGLIAGKLVEQYYLPSIVIAKGETLSKASARSISGFNIIKAIRSCDELLVNAGGHPMAAGFTIETSQISNFIYQISNYARDNITPDLLERSLRIDCPLDIDQINMILYQKLHDLAPFGIGNPEPVFASPALVESVRTVGADGKHLKLTVSSINTASAMYLTKFDAIAFNKGDLLPEIKIGNQISLAYSIDLNTYNGNTKLQLKVKDINFYTDHS